MTLDDFNQTQDELITSLRKLTSYNKTDSPVFSQTFSLLFHIQDLIKSEGTERFNEILESVKSHKVSILNDKSLSSEDWDGAPLELVKECRAKYKKYRVLLNKK